MAGRCRPGAEPGDAMEPGFTWYDILGVLPHAPAGKIQQEYEARTGLLRLDPGRRAAGAVS